MRTPIVPPGTKVLAHEAADERATWAPNGEEARTVGTAPDHYLCIKCYCCLSVFQYVLLYGF